MRHSNPMTDRRERTPVGTFRPNEAEAGTNRAHPGIESLVDRKTMATYLYIAANPARELFVGVTKNLGETMTLHRSGRLGLPGVQSHEDLVYAEEHPTLHAALRRLTQFTNLAPYDLKQAVRTFNPGWRDLTPEFATNRNVALTA
ncbi:MAG: hypothetical protein KIS66_06585 [Fimbriimonadaceae bacterium]|nr:hypothetical protein [Fimbriimonadaceae bacterium]